VGVLLGGERGSVKSQMYDVIMFEKQLAEITMPEDQRRDMEKVYQKLSIRALGREAKFVSGHVVLF
jgi:endothelin-converting enzyme